MAQAGAGSLQKGAARSACRLSGWATQQSHTTLHHVLGTVHVIQRSRSHPLARRNRGIQQARPSGVTVVSAGH